MANTIVVENCIQCGACEPECPTQSISTDAGGNYVIDGKSCDECASKGGDPTCVSVCPADGAIIKAN